MFATLRRHWPEYLIEAAGLAIFMVSCCTFAALLEYAESPVRQAIPHAFARRVLMGVAMGLTAAAIIYSPWGQRSGAHINPATTLAFLRLGKVNPLDAAGYILAQFAGALLGVAATWLILGRWLAEPPVRFVTTVPGDFGTAIAFLTEVTLSFLMMTAVLAVSNSPHARWTGWCAGFLVALFIVLLAPLSGMSINPARTLGSAIPAGEFSALWLYFVAPPLGMLLAAELRLRRPVPKNACAKLHHTDKHRCIFCEWYVTQEAARHQKGQ